MFTASNRRRPKRIRRRNSVGFVLAFFCTALAVCALVIAIRPEPSQSKPTDTVRVAADHDTLLVPTPTRQIARGESLESVEFTRIKWPKDRLTDEYLTDLVAYKNAVAVTPLPKYLPIPLAALSFDSPDGNAVADGIPAGMRAITVKVDAESAVEGWARSGNYVDVIVIRSSRESEKGLEAKVIAENIRILSAGRSAMPMASQDTAPQAPATVTLLVTQEDALKIKTAASIGKLTFALRGLRDQTPTLAKQMDQKTLLGAARSVVPDKQQFQGFARGPDGKHYVLPQGDRWKRAKNVQTTLPPSKKKTETAEKPADSQPTEAKVEEGKAKEDVTTAKAQTEKGEA